MRVIPHTPGRHVVWEYAMKQFKKPENAIRELVSNALDAKSTQVVVEINKELLSVEDWGHGILDIDDFVTYGDASKQLNAQKAGETTVGRMHFGKLSALRLALSPSVDVEEAYRINPEVRFMTYVPIRGMSYEIKMSLAPFQIEDHGGSHYLTHQGTKVVVYSPIAEVYENITAIKTHLARAFGLRIMSGVKIVVNGEELAPRIGDFDLDPNNPEDAAKYEKPSLLFHLKKDNEKVAGNLWYDTNGKGAVDVYIDGVFNSEIPIDHQRLFVGWINVNGVLTPTISRDGIVEDDVYHDLIDKLRKFVTRFPQREEMSSSAAAKRLIEDCSKLLKDYLKDFGLMTKTNIPVVVDAAIRTTGIIPDTERLGKTPAEPTNHGVTRKPTKEVDAHDKKIHTIMQACDTEPKPRREHKDYGIRLLESNLGADKPPVVYEYPITFYLNRDNEVYQFAIKNSRTLGPIWLRVIWLLSRAIIQMNPGYNDWSKEEANRRADEALMYFVRKHGEAA